MEQKKSVLMTWSYLFGFGAAIIAPFGVLAWYLMSSSPEGYIAISLIFLCGILSLALISLVAWLAYLENQRLTNDEIGALELQVKKHEEEKSKMKGNQNQDSNTDNMELLFKLLEKMRQNTEKNGPNAATESKIPEDVRSVALTVFEKIISSKHIETA